MYFDLGLGILFGVGADFLMLVEFGSAQFLPTPLHCSPVPQPTFPLPPFPMWLPPSHFPPRQVSPSGEAHFPPSKFPLPPPDLPPSPFPRSPHARCNGRAGASRARRSRSDNEPAASSTSQRGELDPRGKVGFPRDSSPAVFPLLARIRWPMAC